MVLDATPEQVRTFIMTPGRILDYYPHGIEGGVIEPDRSIFCRGRDGISLLEIESTKTDPLTIVVRVTTARNLKPPYSAKAIKSATFFTMYEDWIIEARPAGSKLTKIWRDIEKHKLKFLPMGLIVRTSARKESQHLVRGWNAAAKSTGQANSN
jgi:hypothetical protein